MAKKETEKTVQGKKVLYSANQTPPKSVLIFSSLQQMLLLISIGMALPVSVARAADLDVAHSGSLLAAALLTMGVASILQTINGKFIGSGYQAFSACDSAAISACLLAAQAGGIPLVIGMTVFSSVAKFCLGSFAFKLRKLFPAEVTGTMVFILGINLVPTSFKYFIGSGETKHLVVAGATLLFMLACSLFIKPLKPYSALAGVVFGYILSIITGVFKISEFSALSGKAPVALPVYTELSYKFDAKMIIPFLIITFASVVDNIGDFSAIQKANDPDMQKPDWRSLERGARAGALATALLGLLGGSAQSTSTSNIGIASASGITSRKVAYVAGGMLIVISFFPGIMGVLSMIPEPVLGAVLMFSMCYIMSGGFSTLLSHELDDRKIFTVFLSIGAAVSTLIPGLYDFLPKSVSDILCSPMIMGVIVLIIVSVFGRIGTKKKFAFITGVSAPEVLALGEEITNVCKRWGTQKILPRKLQICLSALCEGIFEQNSDTKLQVSLVYDSMQIKLHIETAETELQEVAQTDASSLSIAVAMLPNMFDNVKTNWAGGKLTIDMEEDI
ncbi:MAG: purine/pyrimidine permease [Clostridiales bacterium]|nr:purine/pyrimidine permease [Candidatus Equinaster intestinalis]